jgi:hypothetical protein
MRCTLAAILLTVGSAASADIIFSTTCAPPGGQSVVLGTGSGTQYAAAGWSVQSRSLTLTGVRLWLDFSGGGSGEFSIWSGSPLPTMHIVSLTTENQSGAGEFVFTPVSATVLAAGDMHWVRASASPGSTGSFSWSGLAQATPHGGFAAAAAFVSDGQPIAARRLLVEGYSGDGCYANCDLSSTSPVLNVGDFICFLHLVAAGDRFANCDGDCNIVPTIADFTCFLTKFAAGCP